MDRLKLIFVVILVMGLLAALLYTINSEEETSSHASSGPINPDWTPIYVEYEAGDSVDTTYSYAELVDMVSPAVVSVITEKVEYDIFRQPYPTQGAGTGIIIDSQGYIVTNNHVVEEAEKVTVILNNEESVEAVKWVGDSETDLAVIEIDIDDIEADELHYAHFLEDSLDNLKIGDKVMAMGNAGGRGIASTEGTISFLGEAIQLEDIVLYDLIRTSAAINPGNSGGPLVNMAGQVVGINVAINPEYENFGFAISTNTAILVIEELVISGNIPPTWLGVGLLDITPAIKSQYGLSVDYGAFIEYIFPGDPADKAGLEKGDVIIKFGGDEISKREELATAIRTYEPGDTVEITYVRGEEVKTTEATLIQKPSSY